MLTGKSAVITGGAQGIGKAIGLEFCKNGADVLLCDRCDEAQGLQAAEELSQYGTKAEFLQGDVTDPETAERAVAKAKEAFGKIDILVNNAGITRDKLVMRMADKDFTDVININLNGAFYFLSAAAKVMIKQKSGAVISLASIAGVKGNPGQVNYSASKAGIIGMTLSAAKELGRRGIRVNAIAPGMIDTDMTAVLTDDQKAKAAENISLGRIGKPEDVAKTALFLASEDSAYITGQVIGVDGGLIL